jgi:hypothetical protein
VSYCHGLPVGQVLCCAEAHWKDKEIIMRTIVLGAAALCVSAGFSASAADSASAQALTHHSALRPACHDVAKHPLEPLEARLHRNALPKAPARVAIEASRPHPLVALMLGVGF